MKYNTLFTTVFTLAMLITSGVSAVEIKVQLKATCTGSTTMIKLGDVATVTVTPADPDLKARLDSVSLFPRRTTAGEIRASEVLHQLDLLGLPIRQWSFSGAARIQLPQRVSRSSNDIQSVSYSGTLSVAAVQEKLNQAIEAYLNPNVSDSRQWRVEVSLKEEQLRWLSNPKDTLEVRPFTPTHSGTMRVIVDVNGSRSLSISTKIESYYMVVHLVSTLEKGDVVRAEDVALRPVRYNDRAAKQSFTTTSAVVGQIAARRLPSGQPLNAHAIEKQKLVFRGQEVEATAVAGNWAVTCQVIAKQDGGLGQVVLVETVTKSKKQFSAIVTGPGKVSKMAEINFTRQRKMAEVSQ